MKTNPKQAAQEDICRKIDKQIEVVKQLMRETKAGNLNTTHLNNLIDAKCKLANLVIEEHEINN
jgi:hypothetical protein